MNYVPYRLAEVRRYVPYRLTYPLEEMVTELGAQLLPDVADTRSRMQVYTRLYGYERCSGGFIAMRLELPELP